MTQRFFALLFTLYSFHAFSQDESANDYRTKIIPPSPDASSLGKYGDIPVGYYTGTPEIGIPLYTVTGRELSLPISLSYHAGGFKVQETASQVGLGWSLIAGGVVTRTVRGLEDEGPGGYISLTDTQYSELQQGTSSLSLDIAEGRVDAEPDVFFFNVNGISGKFFFDHHGNIVFENPQHYIVQYNVSGGEIDKWIITADNGVRYEFGAVEMTKHRTIQPTVEPYNFSNTGWYLTKITSATGLDEITLEYVPYGLDNDFNFSESNYNTYLPEVGSCGATVFYCPSFGPVISKTVTTITGSRLSRILTANHEVLFTADFPRQDISGNALTQILIKNRQSQDLKKFVLSYSHFSGGRLKLSSIKEIGLFNTATPLENPPYEFMYNETVNLPSKDSKAQDYWGFYNGATYNTTLVPDTIFFNGYTGTYQHLLGANREPNSTATQANLLTQIKYPTSGTTAFEYESHKYSWIGNALVNDRVLNQVPAGVDAYVAGQACLELSQPVTSTSTIQISFSQLVRVNVTIDQCTPATGILAPYVELTNSSGTSIRKFLLDKFAATGTFEEYFLLDPGTYYLKAKTLLYGDRPSGTLTYQVQTGTTNTRVAGGVRIKKITSSSGAGQPAIVKEYYYEDSTASTGVLVSKVKLTHSQLNQKVASCVMNNSSYQAPYNCQYFVRSSQTQIPLSTTSGSHLGYYKVTVKTTGNGSENFTFTSAREYGDSGNETFPFFAKTSYDWARGKMLTHEVRNESNMLLTKTVNAYNLQNLGDAKGFMLRRQNPYNLPALFDTKNYGQITALAQLSSTLTVNSESNGDFSSTTTYAYDQVKGVLPVSSTTTSSKGETIVTTTKYPFDVASISNLTAGETTALNSMVTKNMVSLLVESTSKVNGTTTTTDRTNFKVNTISNAEFPSVTSAIVKDSREVAFSGAILKTIETYSTYDSYGNPQEYKGKDGIINAFLWMSKGKISAYTENASITDVAYIGFEIEEGSGQWSYTLNATSGGKTGTRSHALNGYSISRTGLNSAKQYIVSFWAKNGTPAVTNVSSSNDSPTTDDDGWKYFEKIVSATNSVTISGTGTILIDEVRLHPVDGKMITYVYEPGAGVREMVDPNGRITYFEYDPLGRLRIVRDHKRKIVRKLKYNITNTQP